VNKAECLGNLTVLELLCEVFYVCDLNTEIECSGKVNRNYDVQDQSRG